MNRNVLDLNGRRLILASASPRRAELLQQIGFEFEVIDSGVDEDGETYAVPEVHVLELARMKAEKVAETLEEGLILGADTIVVLDNEILGKPRDRDQARKMLKRLAGRSHTVYTGFAVIDKPAGRNLAEYERTRVTFRDLGEDEIERYIEAEAPLDKAGAYGIQDRAAIFVSGVDGCFYNVVGLPLTKFYCSLKRFLR